MNHPQSQPCSNREFPWTDVHAHLTDGRLGSDSRSVVARSRDAGVGWILTTSARADDWDKTLALAAACRGVAAAIGVHPWHASAWNDELAGELRQLLADRERIVAIGEIGLDFWDGRDDIGIQMACFTEQLAVARDFNLPVILHNRKSWNECFGLIRSEGIPAAGGICHGFTGSVEVAREALDLGLHLAFGGPVTYPRNRRCREAAAYVPSRRLLTESDAPDLPVASHRGELSRPEHVADVCNSIAGIRSVAPRVVGEWVAANARKLFQGSQSSAG